MSIFFFYDNKKSVTFLKEMENTSIDIIFTMKLLFIIHDYKINSLKLKLKPHNIYSY